MDSYTLGSTDKSISEHTFQIDTEQLNKNIKEMRKNQFKIQLGIIIDITSSMETYIEACKECVEQLLDNTKMLFHNIEIGIIGYRDKTDKQQIVFQKFTSLEKSIDWTNYVAEGGADLCEDIPTALEKIMTLDWEQNTIKLAILIADAPSHGISYNDPAKYGKYLNYDNFPSDDKKEKNIEYWVKKIAENKINLFIMEFTDDTKIMNKIMKDTYVKSKISTCFVDIITMDAIKDQKVLSTHMLSHFKSIIKSTVKGTINALNISIVESTQLNTSIETTVTVDLVQDENQGDVIETDQNSKVVYCGEDLNFKYYLYDYEYIYKKEKNIFKFANFRVTKKEEFDKGNLFKYCLTDPSIGSGTFREAFIFVGVKDEVIDLNSRYICKKYLKSTNNSFLEKHQEIYLLAKIFYDHFKVLFKKTKKSLQIFYLYSDVIELNDDPLSAPLKQGAKFQIEKMINISKFRKYSNNATYVSDEESYANSVAQAFSHFTYVYSNGDLIIVDVQGDSKYFTDPAIHTREQKFPPELDRGLAGISEFLFMHKCNSICKSMKLSEYC